MNGMYKGVLRVMDGQGGFLDVYCEEFTWVVVDGG